MKSLLDALSSSVGRKFVMGCTGLFLCFFLVVHLAGNLLLYVGAEAYNHYAHALHEQQVFLIASEVILYVAFALHVYLAIRLTIVNWDSRLIDYEEEESKQEGRMVSSLIAPDQWMFISGSIVLFFTICHVSDFKFQLGWGDELNGMTSFDKAAVILADTWRFWVYTIGSLVLGLHVGHGLGSAFQSLGLKCGACRGVIRWASVAFAWIVGLGFASFPVIFKFFGGLTDTP